MAAVERFGISGGSGFGPLQYIYRRRGWLEEGDCDDRLQRQRDVDARNENKSERDWKSIDVGECKCRGVRRGKETEMMVYVGEDCVLGPAYQGSGCCSSGSDGLRKRDMGRGATLSAGSLNNLQRTMQKYAGDGGSVSSFWRSRKEQGLAAETAPKTKGLARSSWDGRIICPLLEQRICRYLTCFHCVACEGYPPHKCILTKSACRAQ